jgi:excinuclease ABC subunit C
MSALAEHSIPQEAAMLTSSETFTEFGPSAFLRARAAASLPLERDRVALRRSLRAACPKTAGVYGMIDNVGRLIYVGTSVRLRDRLMDYFQGRSDPRVLARTAERDRDRRKELRVASRAERLVWEVVGHELLALLRELELIRRFQPELNVRGRNRRRRVYLYLSAEEAPRFRVGGQLPRACRNHWGPLTGKGHLVRVADWLNRHFRLVDCPDRTAMHFADQREFFALDQRPGCLRGEVDACLAPCVGLCTRGDYRAQLRRARAFLDGESDEPLRWLRDAIQAAAERRNFEHAARLRDTLDDVERLCDRLVLQRNPMRHDFVYPIQRGRHTAWVLIRSGNVVAARRVPATPAAARSWLVRLDAHADHKLSDADYDGNDARLVAAWFRRRPEELACALTFDAAALHCREVAGSRIA